MAVNVDRKKINLAFNITYAVRAFRSGQTATIDITKDDGTAVVSAGSMTEIGSTGVYYYEHTPDTIGDYIAIMNCAAYPAPAYYQFEIVTYDVEAAITDYLTVGDTRRTTGIDSSLIGDTDMGIINGEVENYVKRWMNATFTPETRVDVLDGNGTIRIFTDKNPLLSVRSVTIDGASLEIENLFFYKESGKIEIDTAATTGTFEQKRQAIVIKYVHGFLDYSSTETTSTAATTAGTSVAISVSSTSGFSSDDWIEIYGTDGYREAAKIDSVGDSTTMTVDELIRTHVSGSYIKKLEIPYAVKRFMELEAGLYAVINVIGATYTFNASYGLGELSVVKGVPYTHWREVFERLVKERDRIVGSAKIQGILKPRFCIRV